MVKLPADEEEKFAAFIKQQRNKLISSPKEIAKRATESNQAVISEIIKTAKIFRSHFVVVKIKNGVIINNY